MKRLILVLALVAVLALVLLLGNGPDAVSVEVEPVRREERFVSTVTASGEIVATRYADIGSDLMGRIVELSVREGQSVEEGDLLARIDAAQSQSAVLAAEAQVDALMAEERSARQAVENARSQTREAAAQEAEAQRKLVRAEDLRARGILAEAELDEAKSSTEAATARLAASRAAVSRAEQQQNAAARRISQAQAQLQGASDLLGKTRILAPIDGTVTRLDAREGEMVVIGIQNQPGTTLMTVSDLSELNAEVRVAEAEVPRLELGQSAEILLEALPGRRFPGTVVEIGSSALPLEPGASAREFRVVVRLAETDPDLKPGFTCDAEIVTERVEGALTVPLQAVVLRPDGAGAEVTGLFTVEAEVARFVPVRTGIIGGIRMAVEGIPPGTPIVVGPFQMLRELQDGDPVDVAADGR